MVFQRTRGTEAAARNALLEAAGSFSPRIEDQSEDTIFICGIDVMGTESLFGPADVLARSIRARTRALGIVTRIVLCRNLPAAVCIAKSLPSNIPIRVTPPGEAEALASAPLRGLGLTRTQGETFAL